MVNHLPGHATVDADILACDESCLVGAEEHRLPRMLPYFYIPLQLSYCSRRSIIVPDFQSYVHV